MSKNTHIGIIGLGIIGSRVAANLRHKGHDVYVWSRSPRNIPNFVGSAREVAALCPVLQFFVSDDAALIQAVQDVAPVLTKKHVLILHPTVSPETIHQVVGMISSVGAHCIEAPFTGSKNAAAAGQLVYYAAGDRALIHRMEPLLLDSGVAVLYIGAAGSGAVVKIAANMLVANTLQMLAEALALTTAAGIDPAIFLAAVQLNAVNSKLLDMKFPAVLDRDFEPHFSVSHMTKDLRHAHDLARRYGVSTPATDITRKHLESVMEEGKGNLDFSIIAAPPTLEAP